MMATASPQPACLSAFVRRKQKLPLALEFHASQFPFYKHPIFVSRMQRRLHAACGAWHISVEASVSRAWSRASMSRSRRASRCRLPRASPTAASRRCAQRSNTSSRIRKACSASRSAPSASRGRERGSASPTSPTTCAASSGSNEKRPSRPPDRRRNSLRGQSSHRSGCASIDKFRRFAGKPDHVLWFSWKSELLEVSNLFAHTLAPIG